MKSTKIIFTIAVLLCSAIVAKAQSFNITADTGKSYWHSMGYAVEINIDAKATGPGPLDITWRIVHFQKGPKWTFDGFCDNVACRTEETAGMVSGLKSFTTDTFSGIKKANFKCDWGADDADFGTMSTLTIEMISGSTTKYASFNGYKGKVGIKTNILLEDNLTIFPNPATNYIDVAYSEFSDVKTIAIYNLLGKLISVYKPSDKQSAHCEFDADMPSGIYLLRVADSKGNVIATRKITHQ